MRKSALPIVLALSAGVLVAGCGGSKSPAGATPTATPRAAATTTVLTPTLAPNTSSGGFPFAEVNFKAGDWAKYTMTGPDMPASIKIEAQVVEVTFGGTAYQGIEWAMDLGAIPGMPPNAGQGGMPGIPTGPTVSLYLTEKGEPSGKSWSASKMGQQIRCSTSGAAGAQVPGQPGLGATPKLPPDAVLLGADTYKVPETGQTIKIWKYRMKDSGAGQNASSEMWFSNEVPVYLVKVSPGMELAAFGSGASASFTRAELEANCK